MCFHFNFPCLTLVPYSSLPGFSLESIWCVTKTTIRAMILSLTYQQSSSFNWWLVKKWNREHIFCICVGLCTKTVLVKHWVISLDCMVSSLQVCTHIYSPLMVLSTYKNIMHAKFIDKVIRPPGLKSWLSASPHSLSCYGRHTFVIGSTASLKKSEGDCFLFHSRSMHD